MGKVTTKKAYDFVVSNLENDIMMKIWYFNIPLKIKCFVWLTCNKRIDAWDNLSKKGWIGPNRCCLCNEELELVDHLFVSCHFDLGAQLYF